MFFVFKNLITIFTPANEDLRFLQRLPRTGPYGQPFKQVLKFWGRLHDSVNLVIGDWFGEVVGCAFHLPQLGHHVTVIPLETGHELELFIINFKNFEKSGFVIHLYTP